MGLQDPHGDSNENANQDDRKVLMINHDDGKDCSELIVLRMGLTRTGL